MRDSVRGLSWESLGDMNWRLIYRHLGDADPASIKPSFQAMITAQAPIGIHPNKLEIKWKPEGTVPLLNPMLANWQIVSDVIHRGMHLTAISLEMLRQSLVEMSLKINLRIPQPLPGPSGHSYILPFVIWTILFHIRPCYNNTWLDTFEMACCIEVDLHKCVLLIRRGQLISHGRVVYVQCGK